MKRELYRPRLVEIPRRQVMIPGKKLDHRIIQMSGGVNTYIRSSAVPVTGVILANGAMPFVEYTRRHLDPHVDYGVVHSKSYEDGAEVGAEVRIEHDGVKVVDGRRVIIFDDIADRRRTLKKCIEHFMSRGAVEIVVCVMLNKPSRQEVDVKLDFVGYEIADKFVWGRGLDGGKKLPETRNDYDLCYFADIPATDTPLFWLPDN